MPLHDWTRVGANRFHDFHQSWSVELRNALNAGRLPDGYVALVEQHVGRVEPDVVALSQFPDGAEPHGGVALASKAPSAGMRLRTRVSDTERYAQKANRIVIEHESGELVAAIEIASPGNKHSAKAARQFVEKAEQFLRRGVHLLILDLFPPTPRDPRGLPGLVWKRIAGKRYELPADRPLSGASFRADLDVNEFEAFLEPLAVGLAIPDLPVFLSPERYVPCPLEETYCGAWESLPKALRAPLENAK